MFGIYFGKYLMEKGIVSGEQYETLIEKTKDSKVQLGLLAVETGLMTEEQTQEVNLLQQKEDKRFGDIAVDKGYLTEEDVADLLDRQGDAYLLFIQALLEDNLMTMDQIREEMISYRKARKLSALDLEAIKTGDVDRIVPVFVKDPEIPEYIKNYIRLTCRNIVRFVDRFFRMERVERVEEFDADFCATQHIIGTHRFYTAFCGDKEGIKAVAKGFAKTTFAREDTEDLFDPLDATNEFLNCNNGLFATELSQMGLEANLESIVMKKNHTIIHANEHMYHVPLYIEGHKIDLVICYDENWQLEDK